MEYNPKTKTLEMKKGVEFTEETPWQILKELVYYLFKNGYTLMEMEYHAKKAAELMGVEL